MHKVYMICNIFLWLTNTFKLLYLEVLQYLGYCRSSLPLFFLIMFKDRCLKYSNIGKIVAEKNLFSQDLF